MIKFLTIFVIIFAICGCQNGNKERTLDEILSSDSYIIVDVRTKEEYNNSHVVGSINIPYDEIDNTLLNKILKENDNANIYNKCVKYISVRLRSKKEIIDYLKKLNIDNTADIVDKLTKNNLINDEVFTKAFIKDKINFTSYGPYRIRQELNKYNIDNEIIDKYINDIYVIKQILKAYEFFRTKNVKVELVIINEENYSYENYIRDEIEGAILNSHQAFLKNTNGGIFVLSKNEGEIQ